MNTLFKVVFLCFVASSSATATSVTIESLKSGAVLEPKGDVPEYADCGSVGRVTRIEVDGCNTKPCFLTTGQNYAMAISFIAANATSSLQLKAKYYDFEQHEFQFVDLPIPGSIAPGMEYRVNYDNYFIPVAIGGTHGFIQIEVRDNLLDHSIACALLLAAIPE